MSESLTPQTKPPGHIQLLSGAPLITATRYHDFSCGHRVVGHEGKCALLHGHNYRVHFTVTPTRGYENSEYRVTKDAHTGLDQVGRVLDFSAMKAKLCMWLEDQWDHKFLAWEQDPVLRHIDIVSRNWAKNPAGVDKHNVEDLMTRSIVWVPFNPTAENMAAHLLTELNPLLADTGCQLIKVSIDETRKCTASAEW